VQIEGPQDDARSGKRGDGEDRGRCVRLHETFSRRELSGGIEDGSSGA
jgi:hypothetical protein